MLNLLVNRCIKYIQTCALCGARDSHHHGLCEACHADLPWLVHSCSRCALPLPRHHEDLCHSCREHSPPFDHVLAAFTYAFPITELIPSIKYRRQPAHLGWLGAVFADFIRERHQGHWPEALVPVPMHPFNQIKRGYNQAELLAQQLSKKLAIPVNHGLHKHRRTPQQMSLSLDARRHNLGNAFDARAAMPAHIALVDDVMTTGTTAVTLTELLLDHGCSQVDIWVLARTPETR